MLCVMVAVALLLQLLATPGTVNPLLPSLIHGEVKISISWSTSKRGGSCMAVVDSIVVGWGWERVTQDKSDPAAAGSPGVGSSYSDDIELFG